LVSSGESINMSHFWNSPNTYAVKAQARDEHGAMSNWSDSLLVTIVQDEPPSPPIIDGPTHGKAGVNYTYTFVATNPESNDVYYWIEWGDGAQTEWIGPYPTGQHVTINHTFTKKGTYMIKAKAKDIHGVESAWATLEVSMPKNSAFTFNFFFQQLFERFPHMFPILRHLLGY
jgi:hypothetical protein